MREHMGLYRGKRIDNGEWVEGNLVDCPQNFRCKRIVNFGCLSAGVITRWEQDVITETVGECTGLKDKNGKLIFEGDIVRQHGLKWLVGYQRGTFAVLDKKNEMFFAFFEQYDFYKGEYRFPDTFEIIGNIHDNPELLGKDGDADD